MLENIKNIIFDFGGVLVNLDKQRCVKAFNAIGANDISYYVDECRQEDLFHDLEIGRSTAEQFCDEVRRKTGLCEVSDKDICDAWNALLVNIPSERIEMLLKMKEKYSLYLLSNTNAIHWDMSCEKLFPYKGHNVNDYFKKIFLSYKMHLVKPEEAMFRQIISETNINPKETLFLDDSQANCDGAEKLGINSYLVKSGDDWISLFS